MIRYAVTRRDRLAYRLASLAFRLATPAYQRFCTLAWKRGVADLYVHPPEVGEALFPEAVPEQFDGCEIDHK